MFDTHFVPCNILKFVISVDYFCYFFTLKEIVLLTSMLKILSDPIIFDGFTKIKKPASRFLFMTLFLNQYKINKNQILGATLFIKKTWGQHLNSSQHGCIVLSYAILLGYAFIT